MTVRKWYKKIPIYTKRAVGITTNRTMGAMNPRDIGIQKKMH